MDGPSLGLCPEPFHDDLYMLIEHLFVLLFELVYSSVRRDHTLDVHLLEKLNYLLVSRLYS